MNTAEQLFLSEFEKYRLWETDDSTNKQVAEWEYDYPNWHDLYETTYQLMQEVNARELTEETIDALLYCIVADNNSQRLAEVVAENPDWLIQLSHSALNSSHSNAKWQLAIELGEIKVRKIEAEQLLFRFAGDEDEYTSRRALGALAQIGSSRVIEFVELAWATNHQYQRMTALSALHKVGSPQLEDYLRLAELDGREHLVNWAKRIKQDEI